MTYAKKGGDKLTLEITVLSAECLKDPPSLFFYPRLRPYVTLSTTAHHHDHDRPPLYRTRVDEEGAGNPTWRDTVRLPVGSSFWKEEEAAVHVRVLSKRKLLGPTELGWCRILPSDITDGLRPPGALRRLSYALRSGRHGGKGRGVIHVAARLVGPCLDRMAPPAPSISLPEAGWCRVAIGIPVAAAAIPLLGWPQARREDCAQHGRFLDRHVGF